MKYFKEELCRGCAICVEVCPARCLAFNDAVNMPYLVSPSEAHCILCGHCVSVCPSGALSLDAMPVGECAPVIPSLLPEPDSVRHLMLSRRSVREFQTENIEDSIIQDLLDTARYAPTAVNSQKVFWTVYRKRGNLDILASLVNDWMRELADNEPIKARQLKMRRLDAAWKRNEDWVLRGAPSLILVHGEKRTAADCYIAMSYLELYAASLGLGTCWAGYLMNAAKGYAPLLQVLDLPEKHILHGALMLGYPKYRYRRIPLRKPLQCDWRD